MTGFTTRALQARVNLGDADPVSVPIYMTSTFAFSSADALAELIREGKDAGYVYTRWHNPTRAALEETLASLEQAEDGVSFASGMAAITTTLAALTKTGDHVVTSPDLYGGTFAVARNLLDRLGVKVSFTSSHRADDLISAIGDDTAVCYVETIGNPTVSVPDLELLGRECTERGVSLVVDNTFASPYLCNPIAFGASVVVHSTTKYVGGHHDITGGVAMGSVAAVKAIRDLSVDLGGTPSPIDAWLALRGVATLALRMERHCANGLALASMLEAHPKVSGVWYPGLPSHPDFEVAKRVLRGSSGMLAFELTGGLDAGRRFCEGVGLARMAASLGGVHTLVVHPPTVTHTQLSREEREASGITDGMVRVSAGIEDTPDLLEDFERALDGA